MLRLGDDGDSAETLSPVSRASEQGGCSVTVFCVSIAVALSAFALACVTVCVSAVLEDATQDQRMTPRHIACCLGGYCPVLHRQAGLWDPWEPSQCLRRP